MPMAAAWYVRGRKRAFPYGERLVSGPFDDLAAAMAERTRLQSANLYPDAFLETHMHRAKTLPECKPRTRPPGEPPDQAEYNLRRRAERERLADDIAKRARALGATVEIENWDGEPDVNIALPSLRATIWCVSVQGEMPIISWYGAAYPLQALPGAWRDDQVNSAHERKATSLPATYAELFEALETGICAAIDGGAFRLD